MINNSLIRWAYWSFDFYLTLIFNQIIQLSTSFGKNIEQDWSYKFKWQGHFIWQLFDLHLHIFFAIIDYDLLFFNYLLNLHYQFTVFVSFTTFLSLAYLHCQFTIFVSFATFLSLAYLISCCPKSPASKFLFLFWHVLARYCECQRRFAAAGWGISVMAVIRALSTQGVKWYIAVTASVHIHAQIAWLPFWELSTSPSALPSCDLALDMALSIWDCQTAARAMSLVWTLKKLCLKR